MWPISGTLTACRGNRIQIRNFDTAIYRLDFQTFADICPKKNRSRWMFNENGQLGGNDGDKSQWIQMKWFILASRRCFVVINAFNNHMEMMMRWWFTCLDLIPWILFYVCALNMLSLAIVKVGIYFLRGLCLHFPGWQHEGKQNI